MHPLQHPGSFKLTVSATLATSLGPLFTAITTTTIPLFTVMELFHSDTAFYLMRPAHFHLFSCLTTSRLICRRTQDPVNILPYLHKPESFEAHHIPLPIYPPGVDLPLTHLLCVLHLKSVSVQWIAGRIFPALKECSIIFSHYANAVQSVYMPFLFDSEIRLQQP